MKKIFLLAIMILISMVSLSHASLLGTYYNIPLSHPDMERWITGLDTGMVESSLTGATPTLTAYGATRVLQWDWWDNSYFSFQRIDSDADLQSNFSSSWFPVDEGRSGDPYYFAVKWSGQFYVDTEQDYTYSMGSDDDSWLFIDNNLVLDLGGVHAVTYGNYTVHLTAGFHDIDIFYAERHTVQSGFQLNFFSDLIPQEVPEPSTILLLGFGLAGVGLLRRRFKK